jgi:sugar transferase (PEP-CTERM/EpsH1 system associated)
MRELLFLCHRIPYPPDKGDKIRAWHILRHLAHSYAIHLGCFIDDPQDFVHLPRLARECAELAAVPLRPALQKLRALPRLLRPGAPLTLGYFHSGRLAGWAERQLARHRFDAIYVYCSAMAPYARAAPAPVRILDMVDVDSEKWATYADRARWPASLVWAREGRTLLDFEREAARHFDRTLFVSEAECRRFAALAPECAGRLEWVENGVDLARFAPGPGWPNPFAPGEAAIVFTGAMDYWPNVDAVLWFAERVMPLLRRRHERARFHVVGANPAPALRRLAGRDDVHLTGRVADTRPYLAHAALVVAPLRIARGIQNKVLEAMAMARPVLATPAAFTGVRAAPGRDLLLAESTEAMAEAAAAVLAGRHPGLGEAARAAMARGHDWAATLARLDALLDLAPPRPAALPARLTVG